MGKRGPPKQPTAILALKGSHRAKYERGNEPDPPKGAPVAPDWMTPVELAEWERTIDNLDQIGTLHTTDANAIARYCSLMCRWVEAKQFIETHGDMYAVKSPDGTPKGFAPYPQSVSYRNLLTQILRLEQEFGLTPSARAGLAVPNRSKGNDLEERYFG